MEVNLEKYYTNSLKNNLRVLGCFRDGDISLITSFFTCAEKRKLFNDYSTTIEKIITDRVIEIPKDEIQNKITFFLSDNVFHNIDKSDFISPGSVLCDTVLSSNILKSFYIDVLLKTILIVIEDYVSNKKILKSLQEMKHDSFNNIVEMLKKYKTLFMKLYFTLINKYDNTADYILPHHDSKCNVYFSRVRYPGFQKKVKGGASKLEEIFENSIKQEYNKEEVTKLETLLENTKINKLIARKELKIAPNFTDVLRKINGSATGDDKKKYFNELFDIDDVNKKEKLYEVYNNEPNKDEFLHYLVDKVLHQQQDASFLPLVDNIFDKIFKTDYQHNQLNLQDSDIKFILTLEALHALKTSPIGSNKTITVNLYKDVQNAEINDDKLFFN